MKQGIPTWHLMHQEYSTAEIEAISLILLIHSNHHTFFGQFGLVHLNSAVSFNNLNFFCRLIIFDVQN